MSYNEGSIDTVACLFDGIIGKSNQREVHARGGVHLDGGNGLLYNTFNYYRIGNGSHSEADMGKRGNKGK